MSPTTQLLSALFIVTITACSARSHFRLREKRDPTGGIGGNPSSSGGSALGGPSLNPNQPRNPGPGTSPGSQPVNSFPGQVSANSSSGSSINSSPNSQPGGTVNQFPSQGIEPVPSNPSSNTGTETANINPDPNSGGQVGGAFGGNPNEVPNEQVGVSVLGGATTPSSGSTLGGQKPFLLGGPASGGSDPNQPGEHDMSNKGSPDSHDQMHHGGAGSVSQGRLAILCAVLFTVFRASLL